MKISLIFISALIFTVSATSITAAEQQHKMPSKTFSSEFNKMKSLAGTWKGMMKMGDKTMPMNVSYKVSSAGSSIVETTFPGQPNEMVSIYTEVKGKVKMTHFCAMQNQPTLSLKGSTKDSLDFDYVSGTNIDEKKDAHMRSLSLKFKNKNSIEQHWTQFKDGKSAGINVIKLSRVQ